ncbi:MAG TPA: hypothetical protein PKX40_20165, partial [Spirochaetota bacterium]|nr:hypothetical protein [Spirochaetota bacterium]
MVPILRGLLPAPTVAIDEGFNKRTRGLSDMASSHGIGPRQAALNYIAFFNTRTGSQEERKK